jgi:UDP-4-amino-4,6-dideoxy-N-acetyl-beta-L-altrosamine N-acetyltransferase
MLRAMNDNDLKMVLNWRNQPEVRQRMFTRHEISMEEHQAWWNKTKNDVTKCWLIYS